MHNHYILYIFSYIIYLLLFIIYNDLYYLILILDISY